MFHDSVSIKLSGGLKTVSKMLQRWKKGVKQFRYQKKFILQDIRKKPEKIKRLVSIMKAEDPVQNAMFSYNLNLSYQYLLHYHSNTDFFYLLICNSFKICLTLARPFQCLLRRKFTWQTQCSLIQQAEVSQCSTEKELEIQWGLGGRDHLAGAKGKTVAVNSKINYQGTVVSIGQSK